MSNKKCPYCGLQYTKEQLAYHITTHPAARPVESDVTLENTQSFEDFENDPRVFEVKLHALLFSLYWADYDDGMDMQDAILKAHQSHLLATLERLKAEHAATCGTTYSNNPRDNCKYEAIVDAEIAEIKRVKG